MSEKYIQNALATRLLAFQDSGEDPPIAWENKHYDPTTGTLYLAENFIPNIKNQTGIEHASGDDYEGIYQITVRDAAGNRRFDAQDQARLLVAHFPRGNEYTDNSVTVKITKVVVEPALIDGAWYSVPVSVYWRAIV